MAPFPMWVMTKVTRDSNFFYILTHGESYKSMSFVSPTPHRERGGMTKVTLESNFFYISSQEKSYESMSPLSPLGGFGGNPPDRS